MSGAANFGLMARRWLDSVLSNDPVLVGLGIDVVEHPGGPDDSDPVVTVMTASPFLPIQDVEGGTLTAVGVMRVRACGKTSDFGDLEPAANRVMELLGKATIQPVPGGGWMHACRFKSSIELVDTTDMGEYRTLGADFRMTLEAP